MGTWADTGRLPLLRAQFLASDEGRRRLHRVDQARLAADAADRVDYLQRRLEEAFWRWVQYG